jgi:hypothetical protein
MLALRSSYVRPSKLGFSSNMLATRLPSGGPDYPQSASGDIIAPNNSSKPTPLRGAA